MITPHDTYKEFIVKSRYARWLPDEARREHWPESVDRYLIHMADQASKYGWNLSKEEILELRAAIINMEIFPSMRGMMTAGKALQKDEAAIYNCTGTLINDTKTFGEICYLLMVGCGTGFSVERQFINDLPAVAEKLYPCDTVINVKDSKIGWASSIRQLITLLYSGEIPKWNTEKIRPAGAPLKTFGGRASGARPLEEVFRFIVSTFKNAEGRKLNSLECHDILCKISEAIVCGGTRRSACISLTNLSDDRMRSAKSGDWRSFSIQREMANISTAYTEKPEVSSFMGEMKSLYDSKSGERGIFNREGAAAKASERELRSADDNYILNPCAEIILSSPCQMCNLTEAVIYPGISRDELERRIRLAAKLGTIQSTFSDFRYLRTVWKRMVERDRLIGVSLTGIMDDPFFGGRIKSRRNELKNTLQYLKRAVIDENKKCAKKLSIDPAAATTTVKPSGTVSKIAGCTPGIHNHPSPSRSFIGNVRSAISDPITRFLIDQGVPGEPLYTNPDRTYVFQFPIKLKNTTQLSTESTAMEQLETAKLYYDNWVDGNNVSCTVNVAENEWFDVQAWLWRNWDNFTGYSFLPRDGHVYTQQPYEPVEDSVWKDIADRFPEDINWEVLGEYESEDNTPGSQQRECTGIGCALS